MNISNKKENNVKKITLRDFLLQERNLISSLGVFIALTIFSQSFIEGVSGTLLSLLFLLLALLIFFELWEQFPKKKGTTKLSLFESYLSIGSILIFLFWLSQLKKIDEDLPIFVITLLLYGPTMAFFSENVIKRFNVFNRIFNTQENEKKIVRYFFGYVAMIAIFFLIYLVIYCLQEYINQFLNTM